MASRNKIFKYDNLIEVDLMASSFRENIRRFLDKKFKKQDSAKKSTWLQYVIHRTYINVGLQLYVVEDTNQNQHCVHCLKMGWNSSLLTTRSYHFIIPKNSPPPLEVDDVEIDGSRYLLYAIVHTDGIGHLLCLNGIEGGSKYFPGREIMKLWDVMCRNLRVRKISVEDTSKKHSMYLRLLYAVAYGPEDEGFGEHWFKAWKYDILYEKVGVKQTEYKQSREFLHGWALDALVSDFKDSKDFEKLNQIISLYRSMSLKSCQQELANLKEMLRFMISVSFLADDDREVEKTEQNLGNIEKKSISYHELASIWSNKGKFSSERIEKALRAVINVLEGKGTESMTREEVRRAARTQVGQTGLLDFILKNLDDIVSHSFAASTILEANYMVKQWPEQVDKEGMLTLTCKVLRNNSEKGVVCVEKIYVSSGTTIGELKRVVERTLRDTYCLTENIEVREIEGLENLEDSEGLLGRVSSDAEIRVKGCGINWENSLFLNCVCEEEKEGEPVVECKVCRQLHHHKCHGLNDENISLLYICNTCSGAAI
ncbi:Zinc finger, PHD-type, conserved site [Trema orientale]|uniref:Zinc finger, PHD-type, conserved site n=1 Tax=Trema orientale TaxID=63057 RepID=A0A2P5CA83_TREOI|nr:Zinc finger, PHD-type, conserved site [Trema orientale]